MPSGRLGLPALRHLARPVAPGGALLPPWCRAHRWGTSHGAFGRWRGRRGESCPSLGTAGGAHTYPTLVTVTSVRLQRWCLLAVFLLEQVYLKQAPVRGGRWRWLHAAVGRWLVHARAEAFFLPPGSLSLMSGSGSGSSERCWPFPGHGHL